MTKRFSFDPAAPLIYVRARISGAHRSLDVQLALDTASTETLIRPLVLAQLGYHWRDAQPTTVLHPVRGKERGQLLRVARFAALGCSASEFAVHAHELPGNYGIEGLLGLSFLRHLNYAVRSGEGQLLVEPLAT